MFVIVITMVQRMTVKYAMPPAWSDLDQMQITATVVGVLLTKQVPRVTAHQTTMVILIPVIVSNVLLCVLLALIVRHVYLAMQMHP